MLSAYVVRAHSSFVDWLQMCTEGPKERLDSTEISQPAIYVSSLAAVEKLRATEGQVRGWVLQGSRSKCKQYSGTPRMAVGVE